MYPAHSQLAEPAKDAAAVPDSIARTLAVVGLCGVALIHLLDAHDTFVATPYKGWLYVALIIGSVATAGVLTRRNDRRAWVAALLLPLGAFVGFIYSRTVGLPGSADDIGNWWEPLGLSSLFVEAAVASLAGSMVFRSATFPIRAHSRPRFETIQQASSSQTRLQAGTRRRSSSV